MASFFAQKRECFKRTEGNIKVCLEIFVVQKTKRNRETRERLSMIEIVCARHFLFVSSRLQSVSYVYELNLLKFELHSTVFECYKGHSGTAHHGSIVVVHCGTQIIREDDEGVLSKNLIL